MMRCLNGVTMASWRTWSGWIPGRCSAAVIGSGLAMRSLGRCEILMQRGLEQILGADQAGRIDATEEHHGGMPEPSSVTTGTVASIQAVHCRYVPLPDEPEGPTASRSRVGCPQLGTLCQRMDS